MSAVARRHQRSPARITTKQMYVDQTYKELLDTAIKAVSEFSRFDKKQLMKDARVYSLTPEAVNWDLLRREVERVLKIDLIPVTQQYFDDRRGRRRKPVDLLAELEGEQARIYLAYHCMPAGYISSTSASDRAIVDAGLAIQRRVADGLARRTEELSRGVEAAAACRLAGTRQVTDGRAAS
jgi:hypothetical protein